MRKPSPRHDATAMAVKIVAHLDRTGLVGGQGKEAYALVAGYRGVVAAKALALGIDRKIFARQVEAEIARLENAILWRRSIEVQNVVELSAHRQRNAARTSTRTCFER